MLKRNGVKVLPATPVSPPAEPAHLNGKSQTRQRTPAAPPMESTGPQPRPEAESTESRGEGRVLFIGGWGRCGSTLLDMMLGQVANVVSVGELREIWLRGCVENRPCGCGAPFHECPFWQAVGEEAFGGWDQVDIESMLRSRFALDRPSAIPGLLLRTSRRGKPSMREYTDALAQIYRAVRSVSGCELVVDSSKIASHALLLARTEGVDLRVVHLVRDSRGVAYSASKRVEKPIPGRPPTLLPRFGPMGSSSRFVFHNAAAALLRLPRIPYRLMRYEDLIADAPGRIEELLAYAGETGEIDLSFLANGRATLAENHLVDGNPVRSSKGEITLRVDDAWRSQLPSRHRRLVTALTWPMLARYGYLRHKPK